MSPLSAFDDVAHPPGEDELGSVLAGAAGLWRSLLARSREAHGELDSRWHHGGTKYGWSLRLARGERVLLHRTPCAGHFLAGLAVGEKALAGARLTLSAEALAIAEAAPKYAEGRGIRMTVASEEDVRIVLELLAVKAAPPARRPARAKATRR